MADNPIAVDNVTNEDVMLMLAAAIQAPGVEGRVLGLPVLLWGAPGVGKTSRMVKMGRGLGFSPVETVLASIRDASDFLGIPIPGAFLAENGEVVDSTTAAKLRAAGDKVRPVLAVAPPDWAVKAYLGALGGDPIDPDSPRSLVFFDEFTTAQDQVQAAMLRVIHERVVGDFVLPPNVVMVAAANPPSMSPGGSNITPPVANRFIHLYWAPPSAQQWADWIRGTKISATESVEKGFPRLNIDLFYAYYDQYKEAVASWVTDPKGKRFLFRMPNSDDLLMLGTYFQDNPDKAAGTPDGMTRRMRFTDMYAWPSPRSLEIAVRARAACMALEGVDVWKRTELADQVVCGTIGTAACESFNAWIADIQDNMISPKTFLEDPKARMGFFQANPSAETLRIQLDSVVSYFQDAPLETQQRLVDGLRGALSASTRAGDLVEGASFAGSPLTPGDAKGAMEELQNWMRSKEGGMRRMAEATRRGTATEQRDVFAQMVSALRDLLRAKAAEVGR